MTDTSPLLIDTNILIYATNADSPWHAVAAAHLAQLRSAGVDLVLSTQVIREYLAAATRPNVMPDHVAIDDLLANVAAFRAKYRLLDDTSTALDHLLALIAHIPTGGRQIHDANIVATMQAQGITRLLTHNADDFARFAHLITVVPL